MTKGVGLYARITTTGELLIINPPVEETIFIINDTTVYQIDDKARSVSSKERIFLLVTLYDGEYVVWIPMPKLTFKQTEESELIKASKLGEKTLFDTIKKFWKVEGAIIPYKALNNNL